MWFVFLVGFPLNLGHNTLRIKTFILGVSTWSFHILDQGLSSLSPETKNPQSPGRTISVLTLLTFWAPWFFAVEGFLTCYRMFSRISKFYPVDVINAAHTTSPPPPPHLPTVMATKNVSRCCQMSPCGGRAEGEEVHKVIPIENHCSRLFSIPANGNTPCLQLSFHQSRPAAVPHRSILMFFRTLFLAPFQNLRSSLSTWQSQLYI